jgi:hypothetical protein
MQFEFEKAFVKDFRKIRNKDLAQSINQAILQVSLAAVIY